MTTTNPSAPYFEKVADRWDTLRTGYFTEAVREAAIAKAYLHPTMIVADIGAGTGFMAAGLAPLVSHVHVLDGSASMLEVARKNLAQFANLEFQAADGLSLPLPDASLDAAFANMYLHHCPNPLAAISEMLRRISSRNSRYSSVSTSGGNSMRWTPAPESLADQSQSESSRNGRSL